MGGQGDGEADGGPAFPVQNWLPRLNADEATQPRWGMSLRDWFAGQALAGLLGNPSEALMLCGAKEAERLGETVTHQTYSRWAFEAADAMLARRAKEPPS